MLAHFELVAIADNRTLADTLGVRKVVVLADLTRFVPSPLLPPPPRVVLDHLDMVFVEVGRSKVVAVEVTAVIIEYGAVMGFCDDSP